MVRHWLLSILLWMCVAQAQTGPPWLRLTFPASGDSFATEWLRISGAVAADARVWVKDKSVRVYPQGAFVDRVSLEEGWNAIPIRAVRSQKTFLDTLRVFRIPSLKSSPAYPLMLDESIVEPACDVWMSPGEFLFVTCKGSPGARGRFCLLNESGFTPLQERSPADVKGLYDGWIQVPHGPLQKPLEIYFELTGPEGQSVHQVAPGRLTIHSPEMPSVGKVEGEAQLWTAPVDGTVMGLLPEEIRLRVVAKSGGRYKVRFGAAQAAYIDTSELKLQPPGTVIAPAAIASPAIAYDNDWIYFSFPISRPVPFLVEPTLEPNHLAITFFEAFQSPLWTNFPEQLREIRQLSWHQPAENEVRIQIVLDQKQMWGYRVRFREGKAQVMVRRAPVLPAAAGQPLQGWRIAIDPGHGGEEFGAVSPTGLLEKEVNLRSAEKLAQHLKSYGAQVMLTRNTDVALTTRARHRRVRDFAPHLLLVLHHNAAPAFADPVRAAGTSTYHTWPQNRALAQSIYSRLLKTGLKPFGQIWGSYYMTRISDMLVVLVETAFLSNPKEEQRILEKNYTTDISRAIAMGILDYCQSVR